MNERIRDEADRRAATFIMEAVEICAKAEGFSRYAESDWSLDGLDELIQILAADLLNGRTMNTIRLDPIERRGFLLEVAAPLIIAGAIVAAHAQAARTQAAVKATEWFGIRELHASCALGCGGRMVRDRPGRRVEWWRCSGCGKSQVGTMVRE